MPYLDRTQDRDPLERDSTFGERRSAGEVVETPTERRPGPLQERPEQPIRRRLPPEKLPDAPGKHKEA